MTPEVEDKGNLLIQVSTEEGLVVMRVGMPTSVVVSMNPALARVVAADLARAAESSQAPLDLQAGDPLGSRSAD